MNAPHKPSRQELIAIVEKLTPLVLEHMGGKIPWTSEMRHLMQQFETNVPYVDAGELILVSQDEFRDATELVDFALDLEKPKTLTREELIEVTRKLMTGDLSSEVDSRRLSSLFVANTPHPDCHDLIFYPTVEFKSAEEIVDYALAYKPPESSSQGGLTTMEATIPSQVADRLRGREFAGFDEFRQAIWRAAVSVPELAGQFSAPNRALMSRGLAPKAPPDQQVPTSTIFHLLHVKNPAQGSAVYDVDNIRVV